MTTEEVVEARAPLVSDHEHRPVKVTRQEFLLYGNFAGIPRKVGEAGVALEQARHEIEFHLKNLYSADQATPERYLNEDGESELTVWARTIHKRLWDGCDELLALQHWVAGQCADKEREVRAIVASRPGPPPAGEMPTPMRELMVGRTKNEHAERALWLWEHGEMPNEDDALYVWELLGLDPPLVSKQVQGPDSPLVASATARGVQVQ